MKHKLLTPRRRAASKGVTLIMIAGVMSILAASAAGFYTLVYTQSKTSQMYTDTTRAGMLALAGMADGISRLRECAYLKTEDPTDPWYTVNYCDGLKTRASFAPRDVTVAGTKEVVPGDWNVRRTNYTRVLSNAANSALKDAQGFDQPGSDRYTLKISDAASKINVNAGENIGVLLDNLCRVIGPPLVAADMNYLQPRRWFVEGADGGLYNKNPDDLSNNLDIYYSPAMPPGAAYTPPRLHPDASGRALYGDGYAIARYRSSFGRFKSIEEVKLALTVVANPNNPAMEQLERETKFAALEPYITLNSWVDTTTVCTGKFEWADETYNRCIDRDKSWIADAGAAVDPNNTRGSLRGCYLAIVNGHGAGQYRKINTNGIDWIELATQPWQVAPGPISSYMIIAPEDALVNPATGLAQEDGNGRLIENPNIDYKRYPLCIHRAPVNMNTASDKVLEAMFLGINVQHGSPLSIGTDVDYSKLVIDPLPAGYTYSSTGLKYSGSSTLWKVLDSALLTESFLLTPKGIKRVPADSGKLVLDRPAPWTGATGPDKFGYINNNNTLGDPQFVVSGGVCNEAHELAWRIIVARQPDQIEKYYVAKTGVTATALIDGNYARGPFRSWDDFFFRVVKPWDDKRVLDSQIGVRTFRKNALSHMIMAHFNPNTDMLKFNPNIEWIDRWGRNFTEMESVLIFDGTGPRLTTNYDPQLRPYGNKNPGAQAGIYFLRGRRYQSDEMIDKTDMNRSTTEFSFDSSGIFDVTATGQVVKDGATLCERKLNALIKIYDVWRETTQRQFVSGTFSNAVQSTRNGSSPNYIDAGRITRDATNVSTYKALDTGPECLVPKGFTLANVGNLNKTGIKAQITEKIGTMLNGTVPDSVYNNTQPASFDGQITLASNTATFEGQDTFLASFNGDLDTTTALGNGRELAKTPISSQRVVDTCSILGFFDKTGGQLEQDVDPDGIGAIYTVTDTPPTTKTANDPVTGIASSTPYWQNVLMRQGDLRPDGCWLGACGVSAKDATLKYEMTGNMPLTSNNITLAFWMKSTWNVNDGYEHEFMNATDLGNSKTVVFSKGRQYAGTGAYDGSGSPNKVENKDCLVLSSEDSNDCDYFCGLYDGERMTDSQYVPLPGKRDKTNAETSAWRVQPFRWSHLGFVARWGSPVGSEGSHSSQVSSGLAWGYNNTGGKTEGFVKDMVTDGGYGRPFIDSQRDPEGPTFKADNYWVWRWGTPGWVGCSCNGHELAWGPATSQNATKVFSINNYDRAKTSGNSIGRVLPSTGTEAVIDEYKIAGTCWSTQRIMDEQTCSRYYLAAAPANRSTCPTFTSQTMLQSLRGRDSAATTETVTLARVTWSVFTPRFMHEWKSPTKYQRREYISGTSGAPTLTSSGYRGPFDYAAYNRDIGYDAEQGWKTLTANAPRAGKDGKPADIDCARQAPKFNETTGKYIQPQATRGVEVELLNGAAVVGGLTFINPDEPNAVGDATRPQRVSSQDLRYRVRFRYPVDANRVDTASTADDADGFTMVDPTRQYLLDTPVFDDISITYFTTPKIVNFHEISE